MAGLKARAVLKTSSPANPKGGLFRTRYYFQILAANGEPLCTSEMYVSRNNAVEGIYALADSMREVLDIYEK